MIKLENLLLTTMFESQVFMDGRQYNMATDNLTILDTNYVNVTGIKVRGTGNGMLTYVRPQGTKTITENGTDIDVTEYASIDVDIDNAVDGSAYQDEDGFIVLGDGESSAPQGTITITENGTVDVSNYMNAEVNVSGGSSGDSGN